MKQVLFILLSLKTFALIAQQSEIKGIISIHNSEYETGKRQYVLNAQVEDEFKKATPQLTDATGNFKLVFVRVPEKTSVQLIVKKEDLQVVNIDGLSAVTGQRDLVRLSMAKPDKIAEYRRQIYQVGKTEAEKNLAAQLKKKGEQIETLQKDAVKNKTGIEKLQKEYAELQAFASKIEEQAQDLARRYAPINLDDAVPLYRESFRLFQQGELGQALQILRGANLVNQANKILAEEHAINDVQKELIKRDSIKEQRKKDLMQVLGLKADLHKAKFEWDSVSFCLELRVNLDSSNVDNLWAFADFLSLQNKIHEATIYIEKALYIAQSPKSKAASLHRLGTLYHMNRKALQAEEAYLQSLEIYRQLMDKNTDDLLPDLAIVLNNLGVNYRNNRKMLQAEAAFLESLQIYRQLTDKNSDIYLHSMAVTLNNLGANYRDNRKMPQAEAAYLEALQIYRQLMDKNSDGFLSGLAMTLDNLGIFYCINQKMTQAEAPFLEALKIGRQLADKNPDAFLHNLGVTLNNLGIFFEGAHNYKTVLEYFEEAMYIFGGRILSGRTHHLFEWERVLYNIRIVKDSAQLIKDYKNISYASRLLAEGYDKLKEVDERLKLQAIFEYSDLSWWALFAKDYAQSEKAALRCLELDSSQKLVLANLGHSQLLKDQYNLAFTNYEKLKGKKNREGKDYKQVLLDGLNALEAEGISHKDFAQARAAIEKW